MATSLGGGRACNLSDWMVLGATGDAKVIIWNVTDKRALTREEVAEKGIWELMIRFSVLVVAMERMISRHIMHVADWEKLETLMSRWGLGARMNSPKIPMVGVWVSGASATMEMQLMILEPARTGLGFEEISKAYPPVDMGLTSHLPHSEDRLCSTDCSQQDQLH